MVNSTESTPLLSNYSSTHKQNDAKSDLSVEEIIEPYVAGLRWPQILNAMLGFLPSFFASEITFVTIFTDSKPTWHCNPGNRICNSDSNICQLPDTAWSWDNPAYTSTISEFSLQCAPSSIIQGLPASSFFMGSLLAGCCFFFIGDKYGRKRMLFVSSLVMSLASFCTAFSNNVWTYSLMRFLSGIGRSAVGTCALVIATESVGKKWQGKLGSVGFLVFTMGFLFLPLMAYLVRSFSWRILYLLISVPGMLYCIVLQLFAYESPRWLLAQGREEEAIEVLKAFAGPESQNLSWNFSKISEIQDQKVKGNSKLTFFRILMESRALSVRLLLLVIIAFGIGLVYYGASLGVGSLNFDLYLGAAFNASLQILSFIVVYFTVTVLKRRFSLLGLGTLSGVCCILLCVVGEKSLQIGLELLAFFSASTLFSLLLIYTAELFPTSARNSAVAIVWQALMLAGVVSPVLIAAGGQNKILSYGVFGVSAIAAGALVIFLPETIGVKSAVEVKDAQAGSEEIGV